MTNEVQIESASVIWFGWCGRTGPNTDEPVETRRSAKDFLLKTNKIP
ncbi:hypothetical protein FM102_00865 [Corynebacterium glutamicum]|nr:hypothetical protein FM102_00865 [Corynebacterium glutamicum]